MKKLIMLLFGLALVATTVSAKSDTLLFMTDKDLQANNNAEIRESDYIYRGLSQDEILAEIAKERGVSVAELKNQLQMRSEYFRTGIMAGHFNGHGYRYNEALIKERADSLGLTVEEYLEKEILKREIYREAHMYEMERRMGIGAEQFGTGVGRGRCFGRMGGMF